MINTRPVGPVFSEGDHVVLAKGTYQGDSWRFCPAERRRQLGDDYRTQWQGPQSPGGMAPSSPTANARLASSWTWTAVAIATRLVPIATSNCANN
jgi:hypothetical protein